MELSVQARFAKPLPALPVRFVGALITLGSLFATIPTCAVPVPPRLSVTVRIAVNVPACVYTWDGDAAVLTADPSPKFQLYPAMEPSGSLDPAELKLTVSGTIPDIGLADAAAVGKAFDVPAGNTSNVILCAGAVNVALEPVKARSVGCVIALDEVS